MWNKTMYYSRPASGCCRPNHFRAKEGAAVNDSIPANIRKTEEEIVIEMALPSYEKTEIAVKIEEQELIVSTMPREDQTSYSRQEFKKSRLKRVFRIPDSVMKDSVEAKFENGILTLTLRKKSAEKTAINII